MQLPARLLHHIARHLRLPGLSGLHLLPLLTEEPVVDTIYRYAKGHVALVGALATWVIATYPHGTPAHVAAVVVAVLSAAGVYLVPNKPAKFVGTVKAK